MRDWIGIPRKEVGARQQWLAEEDPRRALELLMSPRDALRALAPAYVRGEAAREQTFWNSRYGSPTP